MDPRDTAQPDATMNEADTAPVTATATASGSESPAEAAPRTISRSAQRRAIKAAAEAAALLRECDPADLIATGDLCDQCATGLGFLQPGEEPKRNADISPDRRCGFCLGVLADYKELAQAVLDRICAPGREFSDTHYRLELMLPRAIAYRRRLFLQRFKDRGIDYSYEVRREFTRLTEPIFEAALGKKYKVDGPLHFIVQMSHETDKELPNKLPRAEGEPSLREVKRARKATKPAQLGREQTISLVVDGVKPVPFPLPPVTTRPTVSHHVVRRDPIFVGGRYLKLARGVAQSLWLICGQPKTVNSVQQCIGAFFKEAARADDVLLVAAGREDADVRMLGNGRPFFLEIQGARNLEFDPIAVAAKINETHAGLVQVSRMRWVSKAECKMVKVGEELKAKQYSCLVWARGVEQETIDRVNAMKGIVVNQSTPTRVLHRRVNIVRPKTINWVSISRLSEEFFRVDLETQAGTYIKEFITGDIGRSTPSLASLLGTPTDILELDVTNVQLDWPPRFEAAPKAS
ncbi:hypothetical protein H9P43_001801 [Blastocladiella emersonii ATCC 22665]|nr:hypothetical protein H9P43_001801 [Blastocladiella emersonii ATCC 22665]